MPRTKVVTLDGAMFTIAPLTMRQVDEYLIEIPSTTENIQEAVKLRSYQVVCWALNNAIPPPWDADEEATWTPERVRNELDLVLYQFLFSEILIFSGLLKKSEEATSEAASGESPAAAPAALVQ